MKSSEEIVKEIESRIHYLFMVRSMTENAKGEELKNLLDWIKSEKEDEPLT